MINTNTFFTYLNVLRGEMKMKVVFHVDEEARWELVLANVKNFLKEVPKAKITVVANGPAVKYYIQANNMDAAFSRKIDFVACNNTLTAHEINPALLNASIGIVTAGVVELAKKQEDGYAYIRP